MRINRGGKVYHRTAVGRFGEKRPKRENFGLRCCVAVRRFVCEGPCLLGIFARLKGDREFWTRTRWRRERNWIPTFSRRIVNAFAALRAIHLKAQNGSANAAPIIRESPSTRDSRGFEDPLATAELSNAFLAAKALQ